jgi:hypothetical protein
MLHAPFSKCKVDVSKSGYLLDRLQPINEWNDLQLDPW